MVKQLPNLIDISDINKDIQKTLFKNTSYRVNIVLALFFIFIVLIFIYFGINSKHKNITNNEILETRDDNIYINEHIENDVDDDYITPLEYNTNAYELALLS
jgi:hypothetical protein